MNLPAYDFQALSDHALRNESYIRSLLPDARLNGNELRAGSIEGGEGDSFGLNLQTGKWADFATGDKGGDIVSLVAAQRQITMGEAFRAVAEETGFVIPEAPRKKPARKSLDSFRPTPQEWANPTKAFAYCDPSGQVAYYALRFERPGHAKVVRQSAGWDETRHQFIMGMKRGHEKVVPIYPYNLRGTDGATGVLESQLVVVVEGENKVEALRGLGICGTCCIGGAKSWKKCLSEFLKGKDVIVMPDNDEAGEGYLADVARSTAHLAKSFKVCRLPGLPPSGDVVDWLAQGHGKADLEAELAKAEPWIPPAPSAAGNLKPAPDEKQKDELFTEDSLAEAFEQTYGQDFRYDHSQGIWFDWDGNTWCPGRTELAKYKARLVCREATEAVVNGKAKVTLSKHATVAGVERFLRATPSLAVESSIWNRDTLLLGTPAGTVDLRVCTLRESKREDYITRRTSVAPAETEDCPQWKRFLSEATQGDEGLQRFLQQICGYSLTGETVEQSLFFIYGAGGNGKSVFLNTVANILGDYARTSPMATFTASKFDQHPVDLAMLDGARLVTASETESGRAWAESKIKQMTGGDPITARFMRQNFFTYRPQFKLIIIGNNKPALKNVDDAIKRRFNIIGFNHKPEKADHLLEFKLKDEYPQILRWMINGCADWLHNGLVRPQCVIDATNDYFEEQDILGAWIEECCFVGPGYSDSTTALFNSWRKYAVEQNIPEGTIKSFSGMLAKRGFLKEHTRSGNVFYGLSVKNRTQGLQY